MLQVTPVARKLGKRAQHPLGPHVKKTWRFQKTLVDVVRGMRWWRDLKEKGFSVRENVPIHKLSTMWHKGRGFASPFARPPWWPIRESYAPLNKEVPSDRELQRRNIRNLSTMNLPASLYYTGSPTGNETVRVAYFAYIKQFTDHQAFNYRDITSKPVNVNVFEWDKQQYCNTVFGKRRHRLPIVRKRDIEDLIAGPEPDTFIVDLRAEDVVEETGIFPTAHYFPGGGDAWLVALLEVTTMTSVKAASASVYQRKLVIGPNPTSSPVVADRLRQPDRYACLVLVSNDGVAAERVGILLRARMEWLGPVYNYRGGGNEWFGTCIKDYPAPPSRDLPHPKQIMPLRS